MAEKKEKEIGEVIHYYGKIKVAIVKLKGALKKGDSIHILGATSDFTQKADSIQFDHAEIEEGKKGKEVGIKVKEHAREGDKVFLAE